MKKVIKIVAIVLAICSFALVFVACGDKKDGNNDTVNNLPKVELSDDMTLEQIKETLKDVRNYSFTYHWGDDVNWEFRCSDNGFIQKHIGESDGENYIQSIGIFYEGNIGYDMTYEKYVDKDDEFYEYYVLEINEEYKNDLKEESDFLHQYLDDDELVSARVENGKLFVVFGDYTVTFYDFNKTVMNPEEHFKGYKDLAIGEYFKDYDNK